MARNLSGTDRYLIREVNGPKWAAALEVLQAEVFPDDAPVEATDGWWWLVFHRGAVVGFGHMRKPPRDTNLGYMARAGVLPKHTGRGLQRRLIKARLKKAMELGFTRVVCTTYENVPSMVNLIKEGFLPYTPGEPWAYSGTVYWMKKLD